MRRADENERQTHLLYLGVPGRNERATIKSPNAKCAVSSVISANGSVITHTRALSVYVDVNTPVT